MNPEYVAGLFGLIGTVVGAVVGACASIYTTRSKLAINYNQMKLDILRERIASLQNAVFRMSAIKINLPQGKVSDEEMVAPQLQAFRERAAVFLSHSHFYTREEEESVRGVITRLDAITYDVKTGRESTNEQRISTIREVEQCDAKMSIFMKEKLREETYRVSTLLDKK